MPRTKLPKNSKRNREQTLEDLISGTMREFDETFETQIANLELMHSNILEKVEMGIHKFLSSLPENILNLKFGDLRTMNVKGLADASKELSASQTETLNMTSGQNSTQNRKQSREDEETGTSEVTSSSAIRGPLSSARGKLRRSKSATGSLQSLAQPMPPSRLKPPTPLKGPLLPQTEHKSRSAYRTPLQRQGRLKAASADRIDQIKPKVPVDQPLSLLRFPRVGETLVSLTGSPVAGGGPDPVASVNIPTLDGVLSLRPTAASTFDPHVISQIDEGTLRNLHQLQANINMMLKMAKGK
ncbi:borealin-like isoform X2 [Phlebotomus papatasi]|uniref:borealin-like isoform X2 n=1 Tax=Phlebotomus papatasi TaxID=29031 RepID=UPI002483A71B|nr:borealin-like isoform X2 [Phlebotomus papatasi]